MVKRVTQTGASFEDASTGDSVDRLKGTMERPGAYSRQVADNLKASNQMPDWERWAHSAFSDSTNFLDSSIRINWERAERAFQSRHPSGSKYYSQAYRHRSRLFRPKTRSMVRQFEAQAAQAYFGTKQVANIEAVDDDDPRQQASAALMNELLNYRLTTKNLNVALPWFQTVMGGVQDATKYGVVVSKQWWRYQERSHLIERTGDDGNPYTDEIRRIAIDRPEVQLFPPENVRIDRGADWIDPINRSPFLILQHAMYIDDIEARMYQPEQKTGQPAWRKVDRSTLKSVGRQSVWDSTRSIRENNRDDSKESEIDIDEFSLIWVHENFMRWNDVDFVFYTAGSEVLLSEPVPTTEVYRHCREGERPVVMGYTVFEAHKAYPDSKIKLSEQLQTEANEIVNQRIDNVKLAMNKRFLVQRGKQVDIVSLTRSVAGSVTFVNDVEKDVKEIDARDVTGSSYQEQDRLNADFDDIAGLLNTGTVQTNRKLNETVGGMQLMAGAANQVGELDLRMLNESWIERVLTQIVQLEQVYENDSVVLALAGKKAQLIQRFGVDRITDELLAQNLNVMVNAGLGSQPPSERLQNFVTGAKAVKELLGDALDPTLLNMPEIITEIFSPLGYRDGMRFFKFNDQDPRVPMLVQQIQELQKQLDKRILDNETKRMVAQIGAIGRVLQQQVENQGRLLEEKVKFVHAMESAAADHEATLQQAAHQHQIDQQSAAQQNFADFANTAMQLASQEKIARDRPKPTSR